METIKLMFDDIFGPICGDYKVTEDGKVLTNTLVDHDIECQELAEKIFELYDSEIIYDANDIPVSENLGKKKADKEEMLLLISRLKDRLETINDGTFEVIDMISSEYQKL